MFCKRVILRVTTASLQHVFNMLKHYYIYFATFLQMFYFTLSYDRRISALIHRLWRGCYKLAMGCYH